ncbi:DUF3108 domain-containing protein [Shewanella sp. NIFS-20-20]|uniref:DUF3108 domain-containing protein n=1 Tax=Shewanella sp. NIFS-20-20 TaxID=2853806 RepID=UPI001C48CD35|nr:DUF3108 domain-containing protein [Shewanella sp. NIFS-20-20]MBV7315255.1 DUF3108 domain-containing protein [Shewanella sp. NIFS-20-20]
MNAYFLVGLSLLLPCISHAEAPNPVLSPQQAEYQVNYGDIELGKARYTLNQPQGNLYQYQFDSAISLLGLSDVRTIVSEFIVDPNNPQQLLPIRYFQDRSGTGPDYQEQTAFIEDLGKIVTRYKDDKTTFAFQPQVFDPMMVQLQFRMDLQANKSELDYRMVKENEIDDYQFTIMGKERMKIASGTYDTFKIAVVRDSSKRQTFFWMAPDLAYLPIRLTHYEKGSKQLDIMLLNYHFTNMATVAQPE